MAAGETKEVAVTGRETGKEGNLTKVSKDPQRDFAPVGTQDVVNVRVGSEAAVESGTGPVLPVGGSISEATKVHNRDLQERDKKEFEKRGIGNPLAEDVSVSFSGLRMVKVDERDFEPRSGGGTFRFQNQLVIRRLTADEEDQFGSGAATRRQQRRGDDLVKGSGVGGGGNPMIAGSARGVSSETASRTGTGQPAVTSAANAGPGHPLGGGKTSRGG